MAYFRFRFHCPGHFTESIEAPTHYCALPELEKRLNTKGISIRETDAPGSCGGTRNLYAYFLNRRTGEYDSVKVECIGTELYDPAAEAARAARYARRQAATPV